MANGQELLISESLAVSQATTTFIDQLRILAPFGTDNTVPTFVFKEITPTQIRQIGADNAHLKFQMNQEGAQLDAIAFQMGPQADELAQGTADVAGQLSINEWNGRKKPQLMVTDFAVLGRQLFDFRGKNNQTKPIPSEATAYLLFDEKNQKFISDPTANIIVWSNQEELVEAVSQNQIEQLVFVDCPVEAITVKEIVEATEIQRIYMMFISPEEAYLNGMASREQFATLYKFILQQKEVNLRSQLSKVANYLNIQEKLLIFMIQVFFDLGFVTIESGVLNSIEKPDNRPLTESQVYQQRLKKIKTEEFLLYSDCQTIQQWLWNEEDK